METRSSTSSSNPRTQGSRARNLRRISGVLLVVLGFACTDWLLAYVMQVELRDSQFRYSKVIRGAIGADVLVLGNSRGVNGFYAPEIGQALNIDVFNLSFNGLSAHTSSILFDEYLRRHGPPKLLVYEVTSLHAREDIHPDVMRLYSRDIEAFRDTWRERDPFEAFVARFVARTYRFNNELFLRVLAYRRKTDQRWINSGRVDAEFAQNFTPTPEMQAMWREIDSSQLQSLGDLVRRAVENGVGVVLVITPYLPQYIDQIEGFEQWKENVETYIGLPVHDLSLAVRDAVYFADPLHMNLEGFRVVAPQVITVVQEALQKVVESSQIR